MWWKSVSLFLFFSFLSSCSVPALGKSDLCSYTGIGAYKDHSWLTGHPVLPSTNKWSQYSNILEIVFGIFHSDPWRNLSWAVKKPVCQGQGWDCLLKFVVTEPVSAAQVRWTPVFISIRVVSLRALVVLLLGGGKGDGRVSKQGINGYQPRWMHSHFKTQATLQGFVKKNQEQECKKYTESRQNLITVEEWTMLQNLFNNFNFHENY